MNQNIKRESVVIFRSIYDATKDLKPTTREKYLTAMLAYAFDGIEPTNLGYVENMLFVFTKPTLDRSIERYDRCVANGKKGGRPKKKVQENQEENQSENQNPNLN